MSAKDPSTTGEATGAFSVRPLDVATWPAFRALNTGDVVDESPLSRQFRDHFGHRDHLSAILLDELANDLDAGGPTAEICVDHMAARRGDAIQLCLLAGVFRIVSRGKAPRADAVLCEPRRHGRPQECMAGAATGPRAPRR